MKRARSLTFTAILILIGLEMLRRRYSRFRSYLNEYLTQYHDLTTQRSSLLTSQSTHSNDFVSRLILRSQNLVLLLKSLLESSNSFSILTPRLVSDWYVPASLRDTMTMVSAMRGLLESSLQELDVRSSYLYFPYDSTYLEKEEKTCDRSGWSDVIEKGRDVKSLARSLKALVVSQKKFPVIK